MSESIDTAPLLLKDRFRGYFPVVIDVETAGFNSQSDALLEIAAITLKQDENGLLSPNTCFHEHVIPFEGANIEKAAIEFIRSVIRVAITVTNTELVIHPTKSTFTP